MTVNASHGIERLLPVFHGQEARMIAYIAAKGTATPDEIRDSLKIPRSSVYKCLSQLVEAGLASRIKKGKTDQVRIPDFVFTVENTTFMDKMKITPRNVLAFDAAHTPAGKMFIERYGPDKFAKFVDLYDEYAREKITAQMMARELGVIRYEVELLLNDIRSISPVAAEIEPSHNRQ